MRTLRNTLLAAMAAVALPLVAAAASADPQPAAAASPARNPMSVHVLDMQTGLPSAGVQVELERLEQGGRWERIGSGVTNQDGRIEALYPTAQRLEKGDYRVTFQTGAWYRQQRVDAFYPVVQLVLHVDGRLPHYHVPLLLSPFGYTTYRGS